MNVEVHFLFPSVNIFITYYFLLLTFIVLLPTSYFSPPTAYFRARIYYFLLPLLLLTTVHFVEREKWEVRRHEVVSQNEQV